MKLTKKEANERIKDSKFWKRVLEDFQKEEYQYYIFICNCSEEFDVIFSIMEIKKKIRILAKQFLREIKNEDFVVPENVDFIFMPKERYWCLLDKKIRIEFLKYLIEKYDDRTV